MREDSEIIELFFHRSDEAVKELNSKYGKLCRKVAYNITSNAEDAEECVNDAYLAVWNAIPPETPDSLLPYVLKIVRNISLNRYQKKTAEKRGSGQYTVSIEEMEADFPDRKTVEEETEARELARLIDRFLGSLPVENRVLFLRRYWFSDSIKDIAGLTGLSEKNVSVRLTRIRKKLKQYLTENEVYL